MSPLPHDPDFDAPERPPAGQSVFNALSPKQALLVGVVGGILVLCTIGFFVLLGLMLRGNAQFSLGASDSLAGNAPTGQALGGAGVAAPPELPTGPVPPLAASDHVRGSRNARLTLIEYSDLECPFCQRFHSTVQRLLQEYDGKVKWVYRHYPLSFHANAQKEAEASECAAELGGNDAFWRYVDKIFERTTANGTGFALDALAPLARELGLSESRFKACLDSGKYATPVREQLNAGAAAGVQGTPGSFLVDANGNAQLISGAVSYEQLKAAVEAKLR
ncbi:MAG: thioredoxin domain-containing protein [Candidatus Magasanikbacteria bacterium]|nr:thioredoxin domain-containing protein [Candidatus Magasanikbacteria bacterium]